jgi:RNA polymerase sigma-70 factor (ECF subfamily)
LKGFGWLGPREGIEMPSARSHAASAPDGVAVRPDLDALYRQHAPAVARWVAHLGGPRVDVDDLVHEIFLIAHRRLAEFRGEAKVTTWLYRITERVVSGRRRRDRARRFMTRLWRGDVEESTAAMSRLTPIEELERQQSRAAVYRVLDQLSEKYRSLLILFELEGMSGEEIAVLTGVKLATIWVRLRRARLLFLAELERDRGGVR